MVVINEEKLVSYAIGVKVTTYFKLMYVLCSCDHKDSFLCVAVFGIN